MKIDYVFTYIDTENKKWLKDKEEYCKYEFNENSDTKKFNNKSFLKFFLRSLDTNLPWINNTYMIIPDRTHLPDWIDESKIKVVEYKDFIPEGFLPTFNTNTVSLFLDNIEGISEHFIFGEDNQFINKPLEESDFFSEDDCLPKVGYSLKNRGDRQSFIEAHNNIEALKIVEDYTIKTDSLKYIEVHNVPAPYITSNICILRRFLNKKITSSLTKFKNDIININNHIYNNFNIATYRAISSNLTFNPLDCFIKYEDICDNIFNKKTDFLNIKNENINKSSVAVIEDAFLKTYPDKSKYEK